ncbi:hypothetical protein JQ604_30915 [Bradyrhizobium jicamae]|nr:hypothetical protein [Bradyrhizobium jicamae]MBR0756611.1 hypothetical protein [Bradyrhizobium jicamae]
MFVRWCELRALSPFPAAPATVARFVADGAPIGIARLWPAVQEISRLHSSVGLADPTLGAAINSAISDIAGIDPPRSWPDDQKRRFRLLPYDMQAFVAAHDMRREKALRRAQNEAAAARRSLLAHQKAQSKTKPEINTDETDAHTATRGSDQGDPGGSRGDH